MSSGFYKLEVKFWVKEIIKLAIIGLAIGYLFFDSLILSVIFMPFTLLMLKRDIKQELEKQKRRLWDDYKNSIVCMAGNLGAGYSVEKAFVMGMTDVVMQSDRSNVLAKCVNDINNSLACNVPFDKVLEDFAKKSELEDVKEFSELIVAAKRYGGNVIHIARKYSQNVSERQRLQVEIDTMLAEKRFEGRVMTMAPFAIILYMRITNGSYMSILYDTLLGRMVMLFCLIIIAISMRIITGIVKIEV